MTAARETLPQPPELLQPRHGVITLFGYGIQARVDRGHLILDDGIGPARRHARLPRVGHRLRRLVVIGNDGFISLAALRWLADQRASFVMLEGNGKVLATTGPVRPSDARLRRSQALAGQSGTALRIARELIGRKLEAQASVARNKLLATDTAETIARYREELNGADTPEKIRSVESVRRVHIGPRGALCQSIFPKRTKYESPIIGRFSELVSHR
jgi:CRISPR associated protein Cas1